MMGEIGVIPGARSDCFQTCLLEECILERSTILTISNSQNPFRVYGYKCTARNPLAKLIVCPLPIGFYLLQFQFLATCVLI